MRFIVVLALMAAAALALSPDAPAEALEPSAKLKLKPQQEELGAASFLKSGSKAKNQEPSRDQEQAEQGEEEEANEVRDLGAGDMLGERTAATIRAGGFFSALQTSGSFVMMQAGGFEELGEGSLAVTRRRRFNHRVLSNTTNPAKCGDDTGNQDQEQLRGLLDCSSRPHTDCATRRRQSVLRDCRRRTQRIHRRALSGYTMNAEQCPDNLSTGMSWARHALSGGGQCWPLTGDRALSRRTMAISSKTDPNAGQATKAFPLKVSMTSDNTGAIAIKRVVCKNSVCSSFKSVTCISCRRRTSLGKVEHKVSKNQLKNFVKHCVMKAFENPGKHYAQLKQSYVCSAEDLYQTSVWAALF